MEVVMEFAEVFPQQNQQYYALAEEEGEEVLMAKLWHLWVLQPQLKKVELDLGLLRRTQLVDL